MQELALNFEKSADADGAYIVRFSGAFDGVIREQVSELEALVKDENNKHFVFDLSGLTFVNSYGIGQLVSWHNSVAAKGGKILLAGPQKNVADTFGVVGIDKMIEVHPDVPSAVTALKT